MAEADLDDSEHLMNCTVCCNRFNDDQRKPKYLSCHHTFCLLCIQSMSEGTSVICPFCRKETKVEGEEFASLANNPYILHMIGGTLSYMESQGLKSNQQWCLKCRKKSTKFCVLLSDHSTFTVGQNSTESNLVTLQQSMDSNENLLNRMLLKRKELKNHLIQLGKSLQVVEIMIKRQNEENELHLSEMVSLLEDKHFIDEQSYAAKIKESSNFVHQELLDLMELEENHLSHLKNTKITVEFKDENGRVLPSNLQKGFTFINGGEENYQLTPMTIASYVLLSMLIKRTHPTGSSQRQVALPPIPSNAEKDDTLFLWSNLSLSIRLGMTTALLLLLCIPEIRIICFFLLFAFVVWRIM